jgi:TLD
MRCQWQGVWPNSTVLSRVAEVVRCEFVAKLSSEWLRGKRFVLLYRGSRDGMTAAAFHRLCDGKGPTLVLIAGQSDGQPVCVFGGFADKHWELPAEGVGKFVTAPDSFLFTVVNPFGDGIVKMPVVEGRSVYAMYCYASSGPCFGYSNQNAIAVYSHDHSPAAVFSDTSYCNPSADCTFGDPLGRGDKSFTGAKCFNPLDIEVWSVI